MPHPGRNGKHDRPFKLLPIEGPPLPPLDVDAHAASAGALIVGRSHACHIILDDAAVSRRHAAITHRSDGWFITDLGSRHGTLVNGVALRADAAAPINPGDHIRIAPWTLHFAGGAPPAALRRIRADVRSHDDGDVEAVADEATAVTRTRLDLLIECAGAISSCADEADLADAVLSAAATGSGYPRAAFIRDASDGLIEIINSLGPEGLSFSRSLVDAARLGKTVRLTRRGDFDDARSIVSLGIQTALCVPVFVGSSIIAYLYLDARDGESSVHEDAAGFCQALARLAGLAMANFQRVDLERRQTDLVRDINAAREAQRLILPPETGSIDRVKYAMRVISGRFVAGDLFDIVPVPGGRVGIFLGDVTGKGVGAAILMATAQTHLQSALRAGESPAEAASGANRFLCDHSSEGRFISLFIGVIDPAAGRVAFVDAGHGHWLLAPRGKPAAPVRSVGGIPLGIVPDAEYRDEHAEFSPGDRLILYSDGVVEQPSATGEPFGVSRLIDAAQNGRPLDEQVIAILAALRDFAGTDKLADDTTVAVVELT